MTKLFCLLGRLIVFFPQNRSFLFFTSGQSKCLRLLETECLDIKEKQFNALKGKTPILRYCVEKNLDEIKATNALKNYLVPLSMQAGINTSFGDLNILTFYVKDEEQVQFYFVLFAENMGNCLLPGTPVFIEEKEIQNQQYCGHNDLSALNFFLENEKAIPIKNAIAVSL